MNQTPWGAVDEHGTVSVREGETWRAVGQYPDATPEEALAFFERKFADLEGQVRLLEQRIRSGANANDVAKAASRLKEQVQGANAVGDLANLASRLEKLEGDLGELTEQQRAAHQAEVEAAKAERAAIVEEVEALASRDVSTIQWKQLGTQLDELFQRWQQHQRTAPRLPKSEADALWKRFRAARTSLEHARRAFFSELESQHKQAKAAKQALIARATELGRQGSDGIPAYRALLDEWKAAGRAGRKVDDALWAEFKAAGDVLFQAKAEVVAVENEEYEANLLAKRELLAEATPILDIDDHRKAKDALVAIQRKWDEIGRVPRAAIREIEDGLRKVEAHVRSLDEQHWQSTNPERKARSEGLAGQLEDAVQQLEAELASAQAAGDAKTVAAVEDDLATKRQWLDVVVRAK